MTIAVEASELDTFTPDSLANLAAPPVFTLRPATDRDWRKYQKLLRTEGLVYHDDEEIRAAVLDALQRRWSPDVFEKEAARLRSFWTLLDQKGEPEEEEQQQVGELIQRIFRDDERLGAIEADNAEFVEESLRIAVSMFVMGWSNVEIAYSRENGLVPSGTLTRLARWLADTERKAVEDKVKGVIRPGVAWLQLCNRCQSQLRLTQDEEKNSSSPPPAPQDRSGSTTKPSRKTAAASSKASASSEPAPAA